MKRLIFLITIWLVTSFSIIGGIKIMDLIQERNSTAFVLTTFLMCGLFTLYGTIILDYEDEE